MTAYVVDTNVVSELVKPEPDRSVLKFLSHEGDLWLSVVTLHELACGVARIPDAGRRQRISTWVESVKTRFAGRLINVDETIAEAAGAHAVMPRLKGVRWLLWTRSSRRPLRFDP